MELERSEEFIFFISTKKSFLGEHVFNNLSIMTKEAVIKKSGEIDEAIIVSLLLKNADSFKGYVGNRIWSIGEKDSRKFTAYSLMKIIDKNNIKENVDNDLINRLEKGIAADPEYYLFNNEDFDYWQHGFNKDHSVIIFRRTPKLLVNENFGEETIATDNNANANMKCGLEMQITDAKNE